MKKNLLVYLAAATFLFAQSCNKDNQATKTNQRGAVSTGTGFHLDGAGQHGTFKITSANGGNPAEVANFGLTDGATSDAAAVYTAAEHQIWRITDLGTGYYTIMNDGTGKFAQSYLYSGAQRFIQVYANTSESQQWQIINVGPSYYKIVNRASGLVLTNTGSGILSLTPYANNNTQWWNFTIMADQAYRDDAVVNFFHRKHGSISFDQGNSIPLSYGANAGKSLWIAEDTYTDVLLKPNGMFNCPQFFNIHNSALLQPANHSWDQANTNNITTTNSVYQYEVLASPGGHNSSETWPGVGVEIGSHVYMYAAEQPASAGFNKVVIYDFTENASGGLDWGTAVRHEIPGVSDQDTITYCAGMVRPGDGYVYVYGSQNVFLVKDMYIARFAEGTPFVWTFWNGTAWAARPTYTTAAQIKMSGQSDNAVQANTCFSYVNGKWVMMQMDLGYFCDNTPHSIYMSTSSSMFGPFTAKKAVFSIEDRINGHLCNYYTPAIHPQFNDGKNELLITYCLNYTGCNVSTCTNGYLDPNFYQVKGVRVPYALMGL